MNLRPPTTIVLATAALLVSGGIAYAAVQSVDTQPNPQVVVPTSVSPSSGARGGHGADDPATHDVNDDHGGARGGHGADDPATHDVNDNHGGMSGSDDSGSDDSGSDDSGSGRSGSDDDGSGHGGHGGDD